MKPVKVSLKTRKLIGVAINQREDKGMNVLQTKRLGGTRCYRLYFEPIQKIESINLVKKFFDSASIFDGEGIFIGDSEALLVVEIHTDADSNKIATLAEELRALNGQEVVRITSHVIDIWDIKTASKADKRIVEDDKRKYHYALDDKDRPYIVYD